MQIGKLNSEEIGLFPTVTTTRIGGKIPLPPDSTEDDILHWTWQTHHATGIELHFTFEKSVYCASFCVSFAKDAPQRAEILNANGICIGSASALQAQEWAIEVGEIGQSFTLRLLPDMTDIGICSFSFFGAVPERTQLYPSPACVQWQEGELPVFAAKQICTDGNKDACFAAAYLVRHAAEHQWPLTTASAGEIQLLYDATLPTDAYRLNITARSVTLCAGTRLGFLYGVERLLELEHNGIIPCCHIEDAPYKEIRGVHLFLPAKKDIAFTKSLIERILIPYHYNQIILEFAGGMRFDSHPEISEGWLRANRLTKEGKIPPLPHGGVAGGELLEKNEVRELCDFIHELGFELIPEVQSFGHVQYITYAHPDIAEIAPAPSKNSIDGRDADIPPSLFYAHSYCPQNKKSYAIIHDLIDEIVEVTRPQRFVHMGHDEIYQIGQCPKCSTVAPDVLYEMHVTDLHAYLAAKGLRMMLWADMVQPVSKYRCYPALDRLPKDIVWLDFIWYFHTDKNIEQNLLEKGVSVMIGNLYSSHFPRYATRAAQKGILGGQLSCWVETNEKSLAREGKFYDLLYTAEMLWSDSYCEQARNAYAACIAARLPRLRAALRKGVLYQIKDEIPLPLAKESAPLPVPSIAVTPAVCVPIDQKAAGLRFVHTTLYREKRIAWQELVRIGTYCIEYEDGTAVEIPVEYDGNIRCFTYRFGEPLHEKYYRHEGYVCAYAADPITVGRTSDGKPITLYALDVENPYPSKKICRVICNESNESAAGLRLCGLWTLTPKEV